ncbi:stalk domain-containing protein [Phosphitispora fastidiosa]|uniref:stalk domain-containing protein n=1 Tax=Phosphitispora fastidiosa TaxID=2837202 RepID=UPI001E56EC08|nr:hypothetical protein [Phosphitispora fastidiosa]MBU7005989.1 membrane protein implicated in regulation of membrane protease activity [Phosphitispora fastidiosa]
MITKKCFLKSAKAMIIFTLLILSLLVLSAVPVYAASTWETVGNTGFSAGWSEYTSMAMDSSGKPYVVYQDDGNGLKATVMKYNGTSWQAVGDPGFSAGMVRYTSIAIDGSGMPYVVYRDEANDNKATVMNYNGTSWEVVGNAGFSAGTADYASIAIDDNGTPYVVYQDGGNDVKATVMKYNGTSWEAVGSAGFSPGGVEYTSIAIDNSGKLYVAYRDGYELYNNKATVMKYNGTSWEAIGNPGFSAGKAAYTSLAIDDTGTLYVAYQDLGMDYKATVMTYSGNSWEVVGNAGFSPSWAVTTSIAIDGSGTPYVAYKDVGSNDKASVMKYNGTRWESVGSPGFSAGGTNYTSIAIDGSGVLYVAYMDGENSGKTTVMKYGSTVPAATTPPVTGIMATKSNVNVIVNGKAVSFDAYNINGNNYFKLRDIAMALNSSNKQFEITWDNTVKAINLIGQKAYSPVGGELSMTTGPSKTEANLSTATVLLNSQEISVVAYNINGNNYFKLRDLGKTLNFGITWDGTTQTIGIDAASNYVE